MLGRFCDAAPWNSGVRRSYLMMRDTPKFYEAFKANKYLQCVHRSDAVQIFPAKVRPTLLLLDRAGLGWFATTVCRLCVEREGSVPHVLAECFESASVCPSVWAAMSLNDILWRQDRVAMKAEVNMIEMFLWRAMQYTGDQAPAFTSDKRAESTSLESRANLT
ncbi:hypothetical protein PoB_006382300 [Plakobranchus ocellatus]|uniref:Reverse transcriptase zinc-binding domain-containing protein n=1 Tax=Plakobranchus ocellatus TaxID=259542 RepID=A0AAV4CZF4_9GAST|nr:hypothetical protein PoB_006382300 [Plakobranchus ocellatus]